MRLKDLCVSCNDAIKVKNIFVQVSDHLEQFESKQQLFDEFQNRLLDMEWGDDNE